MKEHFVWNEEASAEAAEGLVLQDFLASQVCSIGGAAQPDQAATMHRTVMHLFSKSAWTLVPQPEIQWLLPCEGVGSNKMFCVS